MHLNADFLQEAMAGKKLIAFNIVSGKYKDKPEKSKETIKGYNNLQKELPLKIIKIGVKGKFIWIELEKDWVIGMGFGMTGRITQDQTNKFIRFEFLIDGEAPLYYADMRNFGNLFIWKGKKELDKKLAELGADVLDDATLTMEQVSKLFRTSKWQDKEITQALMSQNVLAGVGNYLKAEGLYAANIWPYAKVKDLYDDELYDLYHAIIKIAKESYKVQSGWWDDGEEKPYEDFQEFMKIYKKSKDPKGHKIIAAMDTKDKRTTHWVKEIQTRGKP